jgi:hypothetical protein
MVASGQQLPVTVSSSQMLLVLSAPLAEAWRGFTKVPPLIAVSLPSLAGVLASVRLQCDHLHVSQPRWSNEVSNLKVRLHVTALNYP